MNAFLFLGGLALGATVIGRNLWLYGLERGLALCGGFAVGGLMMFLFGAGPSTMVVGALIGLAAARWMVGKPQVAAGAKPKPETSPGPQTSPMRRAA